MREKAAKAQNKISLKGKAKPQKEQNEQKYYVYIMKCADESLYTGITNDIDKRLTAHNNGKGAKYTRGRLPVSLVYKEELKSKGSALTRERQIKKLTRTKKLNLIMEESHG